MNLRYITCSDPRENLNLYDVIDLLKISPLAELGIQAHPSAMSVDKPRWKWFDDLLYIVECTIPQPNIALHINYQWSDEICGEGNWPVDIQPFLRKEHLFTGKPVVSRIQLNIGDGTTKFNAQKLSELISYHHDMEFVLPYNEKVAPQIEQLKSTGTKFKLLFDGSYGAGKSPENWQKPVYDNIQFGYAGGMSPENVIKNLNKISQILPRNYKTWIDAEGQLRTNGAMDLNKARAYLNNALKWNQMNTK